MENEEIKELYNIYKTKNNDIFIEKHSIFKLYDTFINDINNNNDINNTNDINIDFINKNIIMENNDIIKILKLILKLTESNSVNNTTLLFIIIYEIVLNNHVFVINNKKFLNTIYKKLNEFNTLHFELFNKYKIYNNNINPLTTINNIILDKYNYLLDIVDNKNNQIEIDINTTIFKNLNEYLLNVEPLFSSINNIEQNEINNHPLLNYLCLKSNLCVLNIKNAIKYDLIMIQKLLKSYILLLKKCTKNTNNYYIITLVIFEIILQNNDLIKTDNNIKSIFFNILNELIKNSLHEYDELKIYNYNINPLITVFKLYNYYFN